MENRISCASVSNLAKRGFRYPPARPISFPLRACLTRDPCPLSGRHQLRPHPSFDFDTDPCYIQITEPRESIPCTSPPILESKQRPLLSAIQCV